MTEQIKMTNKARKAAVSFAVSYSSYINDVFKYHEIMTGNVKISEESELSLILVSLASSCTRLIDAQKAVGAELTPEKTLVDLREKVRSLYVISEELDVSLTGRGFKLLS